MASKVDFFAAAVFGLAGFEGATKVIVGHQSGSNFIKFHQISSNELYDAYRRENGCFGNLMNWKGVIERFLMKK
ncbi:hypothetical protein LOZ80_18565 [Paenibacillus sp. HWE-109]|uniref:hypothetical protein n=1 Tax=Paenibacillus sp. HWE-109 TaxID=1306526 RepID=UPI001EE10C0B|nr:hypothetical protein [Paenibacillus sp. HWE-109]UKS30829.1 hypothetical protein LOZ80_18565 [Paenibacillus sp. HWE-109]